MVQTMFICVSIFIAGAVLAMAIDNAAKMICSAIDAHADRVEASARKLEETIYSEVLRISQKLDP